MLYTTNRRNGVDFDLVARDLATGAETVLYDGGGWVMEVSASPDDQWVVLCLASTPANSMQLLLVETATQAVTELTPADAQNDQGQVSWLPDSSAFVVSSDADRDHKALRRYDLSMRRGATYWWTMRTTWPGGCRPDGEHLLVALSTTVRCHSRRTGWRTVLSSVASDLPAGGCCSALLDDAEPGLVAGRVVRGPDLQLSDPLRRRCTGTSRPATR